MKSIRQISVCFIVVCMSLFFSQNAPAFTASPMSFELALLPGETVTQTVQLGHEGETPMSLAVSINDYYYNTEGQKEEFEPGIIPEGLGQWIEVSPMNFELQPGKTRMLTFTVTLPPEASGSHWSTIYITQTNKPEPVQLQEGASGLQIHTLFRVAVRVRQSDPSISEKAGRIADMEIHLDDETAPLVVVVSVENETKNIMHCTGDVTILNADGETVIKLPLHKRGEFASYPYRPRVVRAIMEDKLPPGNYTALAVIDYDGADLIAGEMEFEVK